MDARLYLVVVSPLFPMFSNAAIGTGLRGVDLTVQDHQATIVNHSREDIIALQLFWQFADGRRLALKLINWREECDPVVQRGASLPVNLHEQAPKFDSAQIVSVSLDGVVFANGKLAGPDEYGLGPLIAAKWRARRDIVFRFLELALSQRPSDAYSVIESDDWRKSTDGNYLDFAQVYHDELNRIVQKHGLQAAIDRANDYAQEAQKGPQEVTR